MKLVYLISLNNSPFYDSKKSSFTITPEIANFLNANARRFQVLTTLE